MTTPIVRVGDVVHLQRRRVDVDPLVTYHPLGVRSFGKGIFHYEPTVGSDLSKLRYFEVHPGDLVVSNIKAWEGAIAVASDAERGRIASNRFLTYVPVPGFVDVSYLRYFLLSEQGLPLIQHASPGSADRNRTLAIDRFEALEIRLPELEKQRRLATKLDSLFGRIAAAGGQLERANHLRTVLSASAIQAVLDEGVSGGWPTIPLGQVAEINPSPAALPADELVSFVPMAAVDDQTGAIARPEVRIAGEVRTGYKQFRRGDVIFARITPCMQNGKSAIIDGAATEYGYGSTEFHVIRPSDSVLPSWVHAIVRTDRFRASAAERFTGTAGQQRVPADFLEKTLVPVPSREAQEAVLVRIRQIADIERRARTLRSEQRTRLGALRVSLLNRAFEEAL